MHAFWKETDGQATQVEMIQFNQDTALAGASLMACWVSSEDPALILPGPPFF